MAASKVEKIDCDVMISFSSADFSTVKRIADSFTKEKMKVWHADLETDQKTLDRQRGEAILSCKVFVILLSEKSAQDAQCQDELALAYISNSSIFPVSLSRYRDLAPLLDGGIKLMLAKINWTFIFKEDHFHSNVPPLITAMKTHIDKPAGESEAETGGQSDVVLFHGMNIHVTFDRQSRNELQENEDSEEQPSNEMEEQETGDFWERNFGKSTEVSWDDFKRQFIVDYGERITRQYSLDKQNFFINLMYRDVFGLSKRVVRSVYKQFCDNKGFLERLQEYAIGYYAMREVFSMDSTLRLSTIQSLGKYSFPPVVSALTDMLEDDDANIRAVATIALAKSGKTQKNTVEKIIKQLDDKDRLVRESGCLALGYLKATGKAEQAVVDVWKNDAIKSVREAAELALNRMGGELAQECINVTKVLTAEMAFLHEPTK
ncbi:hypothetical protein ScPMuIL_007145 [Solemya velum]